MEKIEERTWQAKNTNEVVQHIVSAQTYAYVKSIVCSKLTPRQKCDECMQYLYYYLLTYNKTLQAFNQGDKQFGRLIYEIVKMVGNKTSSFYKAEYGNGRLFYTNYYNISSYYSENNSENEIEQEKELQYNNMLVFLDKYEKEDIVKKFQVYLFREHFMNKKTFKELAKETNTNKMLCYNQFKILHNKILSKFRKK